VFCIASTHTSARAKSEWFALQSQLHAVVRLLYSWRFAYVENLTWVHMGPNNRPLAEAAPHARCSHSTLLMFRKDGGPHRHKSCYM
jgi:hypothetical protein